MNPFQLAFILLPLFAVLRSGAIFVVYSECIGVHNLCKKKAFPHESVLTSVHLSSPTINGDGRTKKTEALQA